MKFIKTFALGLAVLAAVVAPVSTAHAAGNASLSLSSRGSAINGSTVSVAVYANGNDVNVVTAGLAYDQGLLQYVGVDASGSGFRSNASTRGGAGTVEISRYATDDNGPTAVSGNQLVGVVTFKALASAGTAVVSTTGSTQIASNGQDIWNGAVTSTSIALSAPAPRAAAVVETPAPTPAPTPSPTPAPRAAPIKSKPVEIKGVSLKTPIISGLLVILAGAAALLYSYRRRTGTPTAA